MARDWFRKTTWTDEDRKDFFARLARSRAGNRGHYLGAQAGSLRKAGGRELRKEALKLLEMELQEYPDRTLLSVAHLERAECLDELGRTEEAEAAFKASLDAMRAFPNSRTNAHFSLGFFVIHHNLERLYGEALQALDEFSDHMLFPFQRFNYCAIRAIILGRLGEEAAARECASRAIAESMQESSGFAHHPRVGLVDNIDPAIHAELVKLASANGEDRSAAED